MNIQTTFILLLIGMLAGFASGLVGIGGGVIIVPALVFILGYSQHSAQGTTLALMVPPIGVLAAYHYYQKGYVNLSSAAIICIGFFLGSYFGASKAVQFDEGLLKRIFAVMLIVIGIKMLFMSK
jgi:uncharacterized membrane protein YfcA